MMVPETVDVSNTPLVERFFPKTSCSLFNNRHHLLSVVCQTTSMNDTIWSVGCSIPASLILSSNSMLEYPNRLSLRTPLTFGSFLIYVPFVTSPCVNFCRLRPYRLRYPHNRTGRHGRGGTTPRAFFVMLVAHPREGHRGKGEGMRVGGGALRENKQGISRHALERASASHEFQ